jgi:hypothetical protein
MNRNIKYKTVFRGQFYGDDNTYNKSQYQYFTGGSSVINSTRLRFDFNGTLNDVILSSNARAILEMACFPTIQNSGNKTLICRLVTSTNDKVYDTKKNLNGNPVLFSMGLGATLGTLNTLYNATEFFYNVNVPSNFLSKNYIEIELEVPGQTTTAIDFITSNPLSNFYINLVIIDEDLEKSQDTTLAPLLDYSQLHNIYPSQLKIQ